jgi:hypothetical protein
VASPFHAVFHGAEYGVLIANEAPTATDHRPSARESGAAALDATRGLCAQVEVVRRPAILLDARGRALDGVVIRPLGNRIEVAAHQIVRD